MGCRFHGFPRAGFVTAERGDHSCFLFAAIASSFLCTAFGAGGFFQGFPFTESVSQSFNGFLCKRFAADGTFLNAEAFGFMGCRFHGFPRAGLMTAERGNRSCFLFAAGANAFLQTILCASGVLDGLPIAEMMTLRGDFLFLDLLAAKEAIFYF